MIEDVTLTWATGELLVSPVGLDADAGERLVAAGFVVDPSLDLYVASWTPHREDLARELHQLREISLDPSPFALLAGRRAEGLRRQLQHLAQETGLPHERLLRSGWFRQGEPLALWRRQLALLEETWDRDRPEAVKARCEELAKARGELSDDSGEHSRRWRWFYRQRLRFECGDLADPLLLLW